MASLLTPGEGIYLQSQRDPDWLAKMVQQGQQLGVQRQQLAQAQQRIQQENARLQMQTEQFFAEQARLRKQEDFQNRKFLFEVGKDQRDSERQKILDDRNWMNVQADNTRLNKQLDWSMDPKNPDNEYRVAATESRQFDDRLNAAKAKEEYGIDIEPPGGEAAEGPEYYGDTPDLPGGPGGASNALLPGMPSGEDENPYAVKTIDLGNGSRAALLPRRINSQGKPVGGYYPQVLPATKAEKPDEALEQQINTDTDNLASLTAKMKLPPNAPTAGRDGTVTDEQKAAYAAQVRAVEEHNSRLQPQVDFLQSKIANANAQKRLGTESLEIKDASPAVTKTVLPDLAKAIETRNPQLLKAVRPRVEALTKVGDPSAEEALGFIDRVLGAAPGVVKPRKTGYF